MSNKKLIFLTIFLISLLAISSVSASEDIDTIHESTTDNVGEDLAITDEICNVGKDNGERTPVKDNIQVNNLEAINSQVDADDISIPTTEVNFTGQTGKTSNITINIIKNSTRQSKGNITYTTKSPFSGTNVFNFNNISLVEGNNNIVLDVPMYAGISQIKYKDAISTWTGNITINLYKEVPNFDAKSQTIYKDNYMVCIGTLKDSEDFPIKNNICVKINSEYLVISDEEDFINYGGDCYIDSIYGYIYVNNNCFKVGKNSVTLEFEEDDFYNSTNKTITITKKDKLTIKAANYNSFYTSKKKLKITANKNVKMKIVFKNKKTKKTKTYYIKGTTNYKIPVACGSYSVTITSANPYYTSNTRKINVTVKKYTTFKRGKYSIKLNYKQMKSIQNAYLKQSDTWKGVSKKIKGKYYIWKQPIYKTVKVKKTKYVYKYVKYSEGYFYEDGDEYTYYKVKAPKGYKYCGTYTKWNKNYDHVINYYKFKKKKTYYTTKQVVKKYKKHKVPVYKTVEYDSRAVSCYFRIGNFYKDYYVKNINKYFKV